jgi:hypothetical protein
VRRAERVDAATRKTSGVKGEKALHLVFKRREARYSHVNQPLFLDPSTYRARGMVRTDSLDSQGGLKWVVRCLLPEENLLGESDRFLGSSEWREFSFSFRVPSDCASEEIRLVSAGSRSFEYKITGGIWFDDLSMRKVSTQPAEAPSPILRSGAPATEAAGRRAASQVDDPLEATGRGVFSFDEALFDRLPAPLD